MCPSEDEPNVQQKIDLLIAFYTSGRAELISRIGHRDNALLLFMAAVTALFGLAFGDVGRPTLLLAVAPLGLGASLILAQHNDVIGALGQYCGVEVAEQASKLLNGDVPDSWDTSASLLRTGPRKLRSAAQQKGQGISRFFTDRLYASLLLIVTPGVAGAAIGIISLRSWWVRLVTAVGDGTVITWTIFLLWNSYKERHRRRQELIKWRSAKST